MHYRCLAKIADSTWNFARRRAACIKFACKPGRGWPVLGDVLYGSRLPFGPPSELPRDRIIALHARQLTFLHPIRYEPVTVVAPLPEAWQAAGFDILTS